MSGPSPRVRGRPPLILEQISELRTIPARAGPTLVYALGRMLPGDHPRACGADAPVSRGAVLDGGPSPRVRGRPLRRFLLRFRIRTIPARAGPTLVDLRCYGRAGTFSFSQFRQGGRSAAFCRATGVYVDRHRTSGARKVRDADDWSAV